MENVIVTDMTKEQRVINFLEEYKYLFSRPDVLSAELIDKIDVLKNDYNKKQAEAVQADLNGENPDLAAVQAMKTEMDDKIVELVKKDILKRKQEQYGPMGIPVKLMAVQKGAHEIKIPEKFKSIFNLKNNKVLSELVGEFKKAFSFENVMKGKDENPTPNVVAPTVENEPVVSSTIEVEQAPLPLIEEVAATTEINPAPLSLKDEVAAEFKKAFSFENIVKSKEENATTDTASLPLTKDSVKELIMKYITDNKKLSLEEIDEVALDNFSNKVLTFLDNKELVVSGINIYVASHFEEVKKAKTTTNEIVPPVDAKTNEDFMVQIRKDFVFEQPKVAKKQKKDILVPLQKEYVLDQPNATKLTDVLKAVAEIKTLVTETKEVSEVGIYQQLVIDQLKSNQEVMKVSLQLIEQNQEVLQGIINLTAMVNQLIQKNITNNNVKDLDDLNYHQR